MADLDFVLDEDKQIYSNPTDDQAKAVIDGVSRRPSQHSVQWEDDELVLPDPEPEPAPVEVKEIIEDEEVFKGGETTKRAKKKASVKQLEHLAKAREKANRTRKANQLKRQEAKLNNLKDDLPMPKVIKNDTINDLKINETKIQEYKKDLPSFQQFTADDIKKLQEDAISNYEVKRKARKVVKKQVQQEEHKHQQNYEAVTKAMKPNNDTEDVCFN